MDERPDLAGTLLALADDFVALGRVTLAIADEQDLLAAVARVAQARIEPAEWVSITTLAGGEFRTMASTDPRAERADAIQYAVGSGPCVDAILEENDVLVRDLRTDERWPTFGRRVADEFGVRSMMAFRLTMDVKDTIAALNVFSCAVDAFDAGAVATGRLMATYSALGLNSIADRRRAEELQQALGTAREIGIAIGVLMVNEQLTREQAFDVLRAHSQDQNRKLREIAAHVAETGALPHFNGHAAQS
ncbi:GAF and ANTAR domain-containing protein [Sporichthya brevicatena]|uniref:GAF and ANTAR domain-containing protein n=1 Tax=Sporichthya brevicatena TaxID=171442 RepID=A0ABN1H3L5_9ACTN